MSKDKKNNQRKKTNFKKLYCQLEEALENKELEKFIENFEKIIKLNSLNNKKLDNVNNLLNRLVFIDFPDTIDKLISSYEMAKLIDDKILQTNILFKIFSYYKANGSYNQAVEYHTKLLQVLDDIYLGSVFSKNQELEPPLTEKKAKMFDNLNLAFEFMQIGITVSNLNGKITYTNSAEARMHGYEREELIGKDIGIFSKPSYRKPMRLEEIKNLQGDIRETVNIRKDGSVFPVRIRRDVIKDENGIPIALVTTSEDITEKKKYEKKLLRLASIVKNSEDAIIGLNIEGKITSWNTGAEQIFNISRHEILEKPFDKIFKKESLEDINENFNRILNNEYVNNFEAIGIKNFNQYFDVSITLSPVKNLNNQIIGISAVIRDITEKKKTLQILRKNYEKYRGIFKLTPDLVFYIKNTGKIIECNETIKKWFRIEPESIVGKYLQNLSLLDEESKNKVKKIIDYYSTYSKILPFDISFNHSSKSVIGELKINAIKDKYDNIAEYVVVISDITKRKHYEDKIEDLNQMLRMIRRINQHITRIKDRKKLLKKICSTLILHTHYLGAGIILLNSKHEIENFFGKEVSEHLKNMILQTKQNKLPDLFNQVMTKEKALTTTFQYSKEVNKQKIMLVRLLYNEELLGILFVTFAADMKAFKDEINLFEELGSDISYALYTLELHENQKIMQQKLQKSEKKYKRLFQNANDAIFIHNYQGNLIDVNQKACDMLKYQKDELLNLNVKQFSKNIDGSINPLADIQKEGSISFEDTFYKSNNIEVNVEVNAKIIDETNEVVQAIVRDISERVWIEEALNKNVTLLSTLIETIPHPIFYKDYNGVYLGCNQAYSEFLGIPKSEIIGNIAKNLVDEKTAAMFRQSERELMKSKNKFRVTESKILFSDGKYHDVVTTLSFYKLPKHNINGIVGIMMDVSERKAYEQALEESEKRLKTVLYALPIGVILVNRNTHKIFDINNKAQEMLKLGKTDIVGKECRKFMCKELDDCPVDCSNQTRLSTEGKLFIKNNKTIPILKKVVPITIKNRKLLLETFLDISKIKSIQEKLENSKEKLRLLVEGLKDVVLKISNKGKIEYCSSVIEKFGGYRTDEVVGKNIVRFFVNRLEYLKSIAKYKRALKSKKSFSYEFVFKPKTGEHFYAEVSALPIWRDDKVIAVQSVLRNIDERKKAENRQKILLKKFENINNELKHFAYVVSHDLKAPLRGINTLSHWIKEDYEDVLDQTGKENLEMLIGRVRRMHNLIEGILQYSRVGRHEEKMIPVNLNDIVNNTISFLSPPEAIIIDIETSLPVIKIEETRIAQVFQNLLSNAIKYCNKDKGAIRIGCDYSHDKIYQFYVSDNGIGIEEKYYDKIFEIFQSVDDKNDIESTGIGLALVKKIVNMYGGEIWLDSVPAKGTTFYFTLPKLIEKM